MQTCLVVDDSTIIRRIMGVMLAKLGFVVVETGSVAGALAACAESIPDLALVDWNLPDEDGISLVPHLRRMPGGERIKIIMCTVERSVTHIETALAAGADEYITKPFGYEVLETKLGYLGFPRPELDLLDPGTRRHFSRVGFAGMTVADREEATFAKGEIIFRQGDQPDLAYILLSGKVTMTCARPDGRTLAFTYRPFDLFGDLALVENSPRPGTAVAEENCTLMCISKSRFQAELDGVSPFMRNWIESLSDQILDLIDHQPG